MNEAVKIRPWHREPWPWIVMAGPAIVVVASFVSAWLAVRGADPIVDENYYEHGLRINTELARDRQAIALQLRADLRLSGVRRGDEVRLELNSVRPLTDTALRIRLMRDGDLRTERSAVLGRRPGPDGTASFYGRWLQAPQDPWSLADGRWRVLIEADGWRVEGPAAAETNLGPDEPAMAGEPRR